MKKYLKTIRGIVEIKNIENNRVITAIIGDKEYIKIPLAERDNQFRINLEYPEINGASFSVPIQFDS